MMQVARDLGTLWTTLQPPSDCTPSDREALLLEVATASAGAHAAWQSEQAVTSEVHNLTLPAAAAPNYAGQSVEQTILVHCCFAVSDDVWALSPMSRLGC